MNFFRIPNGNGSFQAKRNSIILQVRSKIDSFHAFTIKRSQIFSYSRIFVISSQKNRLYFRTACRSLAPPVGLEPTTYRLTAGRSAIELWRKMNKELLHSCSSSVAPQVGLEPTTLRLTAECSAIELLRLIESGDDLPSRAVSSQVLSAC